MQQQKISKTLKQILENHGGLDLLLEKNQLKFSSLIADYFSDDEMMSSLFQMFINKGLIAKLSPFVKSHQSDSPELELIINDFIKRNFLSESVKEYVDVFLKACIQYDLKIDFDVLEWWEGLDEGLKKSIINAFIADWNRIVNFNNLDKLHIVNFMIKVFSKKNLVLKAGIVKSLNGIEKLKNIYCLEIEHVGFTDLFPLIYSKHLKKLSLNNLLSFYDKKPFILNVEGLKHLNSLEYLSISDIVIEDDENLNSLTLLKELKLNNVCISDLKKVENLYSLEKLELTKNYINNH